MIVLDYMCKKCNKSCNVFHFQQEFIDWTSGNYDIDKFIQDTQLSAHNDVQEVLEWIPYGRLSDIKYISNDAFGKVYRANWIDGNISHWDDENQNWIRKDKNKHVILKNLDYSRNITSVL